MNIIYDKDGNGWEEGALYEFSGYGHVWYLRKLLRIHIDRQYQYDVCGYEYKMIREPQCEVKPGKMHKKPVELIEGEYYRFDYSLKGAILDGVAAQCCGDGFGNLMFYETRSNYNPEYCTNIKRMVEAEDEN